MPNSLHPAPTYSACLDLWCITAYFNPAHYHTRRANYELFAAPIRAAGIPLLTVECAIGDDPFELPSGPDVLQVRAPHVLWQKERLINLGVASLPPEVTKVTWLDGDILFTNPDWAVQTAVLLDNNPIVQPFAWAIRLEQGVLATRPGEQGHESFASVWNRDRTLIQAGGLEIHGHTGFAWAAQRALLAKHGLYEAALNGNGDHLMAHAMAADYDSPCVVGFTSIGRADLTVRRIRNRLFFTLFRRVLPKSFKYFVSHNPAFRKPCRPFRDHFFAWAKPLGQDVQGGICCATGHLLHLWHGDGIGDRGYGSGRLALFTNDFNPATDLRIGASGCLEWASDKPRLQQWGKEYFVARREDGL